MLIWEYKRVKLDGNDLPEDVLNNYGKEGWELFHIEHFNYEDGGISISTWYELSFKRCYEEITTKEVFENFQSIKINESKDISNS